MKYIKAPLALLLNYHPIRFKGAIEDGRVNTTTLVIHVIQRSRRGYSEALNAGSRSSSFPNVFHSSRCAGSKAAWRTTNVSPIQLILPLVNGRHGLTTDRTDAPAPEAMAGFSDCSQRRY